MYYPGILERQHDLRFPMAIAMENQTLPLGLGSIWAGSGAKYSWRGICNCATKMDQSTFNNRDHEIYWWTGLDDSKVLMKWYSFGMNNESIGGYAEARKPNVAIDWTLNNGRFREKHPWSTIGIFGQGWDDLKTLTDEFPKVAKARSKDGIQVIVSNEEDFFIEFEKKFGDKIESESLAYGNEWDLYCMSMAEHTSEVRRAIEKLRAVEAMAVLALRHAPEIWNATEKQRRQAWMDIGLYWEHDWTADASGEMRIKRANWQAKLSARISDYVDELQRRVTNEISKRIQFDDEPTMLVFNQLGWPRKTTIKIPGPYRALKVIDRETGQEVPTKFVPNGDQGFYHVEVDLPAIGYRCFKLIKTEESDEAAPKPIALESVEEKTGEQMFVLENESIKMSIGAKSGTIRSLYDKKNGVERCSGRQINVLVEVGKPVAEEQGSGKVIETERNDLYQRIVVERTQPLPHTSEYILYHDSDAVEITNKIASGFSSTFKWKFDFDVKSPNIWHEEVGAILNAKLKSEGGHYATKKRSL